MSQALSQKFGNALGGLESVVRIFLVQLGDVAVVVTQEGQNLVGMLTERGSPAVGRNRRIADPEQLGHLPDSSESGVRALRDPARSAVHRVIEERLAVVGHGNGIRRAGGR